MLGRMKVKTLGSRAQSETSVHSPTWMWRPAYLTLAPQASPDSWEIQTCRLTQWKQLSCHSVIDLLHLVSRRTHTQQINRAGHLPVSSSRWSGFRLEVAHAHSRCSSNLTWTSFNFGFFLTYSTLATCQGNKASVNTMCPRGTCLAHPKLGLRFRTSPGHLPFTQACFHSK